MKKYLIILFLMVFTVSMLYIGIGCKEETPPAEEEVAEEEAPPVEEEVAEEEAPPAEEVTLKVLNIASPEADIMKELLPEFIEKTGINVEMDIATRDEAPVRSLRALIEGSGAYDVAMAFPDGPCVWKGDYIPIEDYLTPEEIELFYNRHLYSDPRTGKMAAMAQFHNWNMFFYRKDLLNDPEEQAAFKEQYGRDLTVPTTFEELWEVVKFFHRPPDMYGYNIGGIDWSMGSDYTWYLFGHGGNFSDEEGNLELTTPAHVAAVGTVVEATKWSVPGWETMSFMDTDEVMKEGKLFSYHNWSYIWADLSKEQDKFGMASPVQQGAHISGWLFLIPSTTSHPDEAAEFLKWIGSYDVQKATAIGIAAIPARSDVLQDPELRDAVIGIDMFEQVKPKKPNMTWWLEALTGIQEACFMVINEERTADEALDWLQNEKFTGRKAIE